MYFPYTTTLTTNHAVFTMSRQQALTLITPVITDKHRVLGDVLRKIKKEMIENKHEVFETIGDIHFARWIILEPATINSTSYGAQLAFSSNYDTETEDHIQALGSMAGDFIDRIYENCQGYPLESERNAESRTAYLKQWQVKHIGFFVGAPGRSLDQIRKESALQKYIRGYLNENNFTGQSALDVHLKIRELILSDPQFAWTQEKINLPRINYFGLILLGLVMLVLLVPILIWLLIIEFFHERKDVPLGLTPSQLDERHLRSLEEYEDYEHQNQFTQVLVMKPGKMRLLNCLGFMLFSKGLIKTLFVEGKLMGIPTIHFARWVMINKGKRMLFLSNFDGSWQQYLGDFIDKSGWGLTAIWSNSMGFPKTKFTFFGGAYDEEHFLAWSRYYEVPTHAWYSAYPHLSLKNINNNTLIRIGISRELDEKKAAEFLARL